MSRYLERMLLADERIVCAAELHWIVYHRGMMTILAGALIGHYGAWATWNFLPPDWYDLIEKPISYIALAIVAVGTLELLLAFVRQMSTELVITNRRVIAKYGFIATTTYEVMMTKIEGANIDQTVLGRLLGFGTVLVKGTGGGISPIDHVANPYRFHSCLMSMMQRAQQGDKSAARND